MSRDRATGQERTARNIIQSSKVFLGQSIWVENVGGHKSWTNVGRYKLSAKLEPSKRHFTSGHEACTIKNQWKGSLLVCGKGKKLSKGEEMINERRKTLLWRCNTSVTRHHGFQHRSLRDAIWRRHLDPVFIVERNRIIELKKLTEGHSVSRNISCTESVALLANLVKRPWYSRWSRLFQVDSLGISKGGPRSTSNVQRLSQARLPLIAETSPSEVREMLSNSFPILSACLSKNRCRTMISVSSVVVPSQSSSSTSSFGGR